MVYGLCVSVGEMIAFLWVIVGLVVLNIILYDIPRPNVGGVVGLADLYVDPAFGFSLGWAAWVCSRAICSLGGNEADYQSQYNWSVTLRKH